MADLTKEQLKQQNDTLFADNNSGNISAEDLRTFNEEVIDAMATEVNPQLTGSIGISGDITADTYYGDGSNLTGVTSEVPSGTVSGSSQVDVLQTTNVDRLATTGSNQFQGNQSINNIDGTALTLFGDVTQVVGDYNSGGNVGAATFGRTDGSSTYTGSFSGDGSGLTDIPTEPLPSGVVSGSSQVDVTQTTNIETLATTGSNSFIGTQAIIGELVSFDGDFNNYGGRIQGISHGFLNGNSEFTGSFSGDGSGLTNVAQDALPAGTVSGSSQIDYPLISNIPSGIISSSEQVESLLPSGTVSGSSQVSYPELSNIPSGIVSQSSQVVLEDTTYTDNGDKSFLQTDGVGNLSFQYVQSVYETIRNTSGAPLAKGTPVYISGSTGDNGNAYPSIASNPLTMPATYVVGEDLGIDETGLALVNGKVEGVDTSLYPAGTMIYVGEGGGWSNLRPSGSDSVVQLLGVVQKQGVGGQGVLINQLEATLPNITENNLWLGDSGNQPIQVSKNSLGLALTGSDNIFTGTQTFNNLTVNGTGSFAYIESITGSAKIIGDAYIILNNDTPTERYAGIKVIDSGSTNTTASLNYDGLTNDWFYEYEGDDPTNFGVVMFGPEFSTKGTPTYNTANTILKSNGGHHTLDSNITDNGSTITLGSTTNISTGNLEFGGTGQIILNPNGIVEAGEVAASNLLTDTIEPNNASEVSLNGNFKVDGTSVILSGSTIVATQTPLLTVTNSANSIRPSMNTQYGGAVGIFDTALGNELNIVLKSEEWGFPNNWTGPSISGNSPSDDYPAFIGFQQKSNWTDGRISTLFPLEVLDGAIISGSVSTEVQPLSISTLQSTIDFSQTSLFELTLGEGVNTEILASNVGKGQTVNVLITQNATTPGGVSFSSDFLQPSGSAYEPTTTLGGQDIITLMTYNDTSKIYVVATNKFI